MRLNLYRAFSKYLIAVYLMYAYFVQCTCSEFNRNHVGVSFRPYVRLEVLEEGESAPDYFGSYTLENIKTMMSVISGKFSKILVDDGLAIEDEYIVNATYHNGSYASVYTGEAAAMINVENGYKKLTVIYQLDLSMLENEIGTDILLALEAAQKGNKIFSGTVEGVSLWRSEELSEMSRILGYLRLFKENAHKQKVKLGTWISCAELDNNENDTIKNMQQEIIQESDFIVCALKPTDSEKEPIKSAEEIATHFEKVRKIIAQVNEHAEVIGRSEWSKPGSNKWETVDNRRIFWEQMNTLSMKNNLTVYLDEALDIPLRETYGSSKGWWKLRNNSEINLVSGYVEKISELYGRTVSTTIKSETDSKFVTTGGNQNTAKGNSRASPHRPGATIIAISILLAVQFILNFCS